MDMVFLADQINHFVDTSPFNKAEVIGLDRFFERPLIGIADAEDPLFAQLKDQEVIGPHFMLPGEWLPEAQSVITYFLPFTAEIRESNSGPGFAATEWLYGRIEGEIFIQKLSAFVVDLFQQQGTPAVAPGLDTRFSMANIRSNWSERHIAYIAGLGTFGLSKSFITRKGCAGRFGSVVTIEEMVPVQREYQSIYEYCTMCGECIPRCPIGAITPEGKNTFACAQYINTVVLPKFKPRYGCGKCQTAVPCECQLP